MKVDADKMPELVSYLKIRRLYVNEPAESDDQEV